MCLIDYSYILNVTNSCIMIMKPCPLLGKFGNMLPKKVWEK